MNLSSGRSRWRTDKAVYVAYASCSSTMATWASPVRSTPSSSGVCAVDKGWSRAGSAGIMLQWQRRANCLRVSSH